MTSENRLVHLRAEVARGQDSLRAARELLRLQLFNDAVARAYYAAFHFASAVLLTEGLEPRLHAGVGAMLGQYFVVNGRIEPALAKALSRLEVDFVLAAGSHILPVELKSGAAGTMKSLHQFMFDKRLKLAARLDDNPPSLQHVDLRTTQGDHAEYDLLSLPHYLAGRLLDLAVALAERAA